MIRSPLKRRSPRPKKVPAKAHQLKAFQKAGIAIGPGSTDKEAPYRAGLGRNSARAREQRALDFDGGIKHGEWVSKKTLCPVTGEAFPVPAHVVSRGAGGKWFHIVGLAKRLHDEQHLIGIKSFQRKYKINLLPIALCNARVHLAEVLDAEAAKEAAC